MKRKKRILILILVFTMILVQMGCQKDDDVDIYTTVYALDYITSEIVKDKAVVASVYPANAEVHDFEPSAKQLISISQADLVIYIGQGLEPFIESGINSTFKNTKCVKVTSYDTIDLIKFDGSHSHHDDSEDISKIAFDPHIWLDPDTMASITNIILTNILQIEKYKQYQEEFTTNANNLIIKFEELALEYHTVLDNIENKIIVVDHDAYAYWSYRYGIIRKSLRGDNESADPNSKDFIDIINLAVENKLKYVLATRNESQESLINSYISQINTKDPSINCQVLYLDNLEILLNDGADYLSIMKNNLTILQKALQNE